MTDFTFKVWLTACQAWAQLTLASANSVEGNTPDAFYIKTVFRFKMRMESISLRKL